MDFVGQARRILADKKSGSTAIALKLLGAMIEAQPDPERAKRVLRAAMSVGLHMAVLRNSAKACLGLIEGGVEPSEAARLIAKDLRNSSERCAKEGARLLGVYRSILTLSNSEQLARLLGKLDADTSIYVLESRPGGEGAILAETLSRLGKHAVLAPDLSAHIVCGVAECVVVGTDALYSDGFVNKLGSGLLAHFAAHYSKPFYAVTSRWKVAVGRGATKAKATYMSMFEHVSKSLVSGYISEVGLASAHDAYPGLSKLLQKTVSK